MRHRQINQCNGYNHGGGSWNVEPLCDLQCIVTVHKEMDEQVHCHKPSPSRRFLGNWVPTDAEYRAIVMVNMKEGQLSLSCTSHHRLNYGIHFLRLKSSLIRVPSELFRTVRKQQVRNSKEAKHFSCPISCSCLSSVFWGQQEEWGRPLRTQMYLLSSAETMSFLLFYPWPARI